MTVQVNTELLTELRPYGAFDVSAYFNCGNCTAICPLSNGDASFPRRLIRYGQIGDRQRLLASKEAWLCYYCGECSDTCPRKAEPGEFMASVRRYTIASLDVTGISRLLYTSKLFTGLLLAGLSALLALVLLARGGEMKLDHPAFFQFIPFQVVHDVGLVAILVALSRDAVRCAAAGAIADPQRNPLGYSFGRSTCERVARFHRDDREGCRRIGR